MLDKIWHWILTFLLALGLLLTVTNCGSTKQAAPISSIDSYTGWKAVSMPVNVDLQKPMSLSASGRATLIKDSLVHISLRFIGMEVAVIRATPDSIFVVDKYHKKYFAEPTKDLLGSKWSHLSLFNLQNIMLGLEKVPSDAPARVTLENLTETPAGEVARDINVVADTPKGTIDASLEWKLKDAKWSESEIKAPAFSLPRGASRITLRSLESQLKQMSF